MSKGKRARTGAAMRKRVLRGDDELMEFAGSFAKRGNEVDLEYLRRAKVCGFYDSRDRLFAGYVLNRSNPLRYGEWVPPPERATSPLFSDEGDYCEITCIWIYAKAGRFSSELIYLSSVWDALRSGARFVLGGTLSRIAFGIQSQLLPQIIHSGQTERFGQRRSYWLYRASRRELVWRAIVRFPVALVRATFGRSNYLGTARRLARRLEATGATTV